MRRLILALAALAGACGSPAPRLPDAPVSLRVTLDPGQRTGCEPGGTLLPFEHEVTVSVAAIDEGGNRYPYTGLVGFRMTPGRLLDAFRTARMVGGSVAGVRLPVRLAFGGNARVWAELLAEDGVGATGVTEPFCFDTPSIRDVQEPDTADCDASYCSPFEGEQVGFRGGRLVATGTTTQGFFVSDLDEADGEYNSVFVFTFGNPTGVEIGTRFCEVAGGVQEFIGFTEIVFPTWRVYHPGGRDAAREELERLDDDEVPDPRDDESIVFDRCDIPDPPATAVDESQVPDPVPIPAEDVPPMDVPVYDDAHLKMDRYEASLVAVQDVVLPTFFDDCDLSGDGYVEKCFDSHCDALELNSPEEVEACVCGPDRGAGCMRGSCDCSCTAVRENQCELRCAADPRCAEQATFEEFGQWSVSLGQGSDPRRLNLITADALPGFDPTVPPQERPPEWQRGSVYCVVGNLRQVNAARLPWVVQPRRASDILFDPPAPGEPDPCRP